MSSNRPTTRRISIFGTVGAQTLSQPSSYTNNNNGKTNAPSETPPSPTDSLSNFMTAYQTAAKQPSSSLGAKMLSQPGSYANSSSSKVKPTAETTPISTETKTSTTQRQRPQTAFSQRPNHNPLEAESAAVASRRAHIPTLNFSHLTLDSSGENSPENSSRVEVEASSLSSLPKKPLFTSRQATEKLPEMQPLPSTASQKVSTNSSRSASAALHLNNFLTSNADLDDSSDDELESRSLIGSNVPFSPRPSKNTPPSQLPSVTLMSQGSIFQQIAPRPATAPVRRQTQAISSTSLADFKL